jgi:hypothetical protein
MGKGLSPQQKTILHTIGNGGELFRCYDKFKAALYPGKLYIYYQTSKRGDKHRRMINCEWVDFGKADLQTYKNVLRVRRVVICRAVASLIRRGYLVKKSTDYKFIRNRHSLYITESGKSIINS